MRVTNKALRKLARRSRKRNTPDVNAATFSNTDSIKPGPIIRNINEAYVGYQIGSIERRFDDNLLAEQVEQALGPIPQEEPEEPLDPSLVRSLVQVLRYSEAVMNVYTAAVGWGTLLMRLVPNDPVGSPWPFPGGSASPVLMAHPAIIVDPHDDFFASNISANSTIEERAKRDAGLTESRHHDHHRRRGDAPQHPDHPHHRRRGNDHHTAHNSTVYPADSLSQYMQGLLLSVVSAESVLTPALRKIGIEPNQKMQFHAVYRDTLSSNHGPLLITITAVEYIMHHCTTERIALHLTPADEEAKKLHIILHKEIYKESNFFEKEGLHPIKHAFNVIGRNIILEKLKGFGVNESDDAVLYHITAQGRNIMLGAAQPLTLAKLGAMLVVRKNGKHIHFHIAPHHPDLVRRIPDAHDEWKRSMKQSEKYFLFKNPENLSNNVRFGRERAFGYGIDGFPRNVHQAVHDILDPIIGDTLKTMSSLVTHASPVTEAIHEVAGLYIPYYDFSRAIINGNFGDSLIFLGFEMGPTVLKGGARIVKAAFNPKHLGPSANQLYDYLSEWGGEAFSHIKDANGLGVFKQFSRGGVHISNDIKPED